MKKIKLIEFDILKGLLIVLVVIGHAISTDTPLHHTIFWFHMPAFFMISGYFTSEPRSMKDLLTKKTIRLVLPYLFWSILLFVLYWPENPLKNIVRILFGGGNNTTIYSYPFWFVNALFIASIIFSAMLSIKHKYTDYILLCVGIVCYFLIHTDLLPFPFSTPWAIDVAIGVLPYMLIGYYFKSYKYSIWHLILILVPIMFFIWQKLIGFTFTINMKVMLYNDVLLDLIVPCTFAFASYLLSRAIAKMKYVGTAIAKMGEASMTIMFTHAALLYSTNYIPMLPKVSLTILIGLGVHWLIQKNEFSTLLFNGQKISK